MKIHQQGMANNMNVLFIVIIVICMIFSMFFSSADMVYSVVDKAKLKKEIKKGNKSAKIALNLAEDYEFSISTILFGNNVVNILATSLVTILATKWNKDYGVIVATIIFTICIIIFAEYTPKAISKRYSFKLSLLYAYPLLIIKYITFIFVWPISKLFVQVGKFFKQKSIEEDVVDGEVLNEMIDSIEQSGQLDANEADIVRGTIDITDKEAFEIATPRVDVFAIDIDDNIEDIISNGEIFKHSRIPVYKDTIDNIVGILPIKELAHAKFKGEKINVESLMYEPLKIPRNRSVLDLLNQFKQNKKHIAVLIDEYGGTDGIVTMEDILEEIVGDIYDETDEINEEYIDYENGRYIVDGAMLIDDFFELIDYRDNFETNYSTVSGFCQEILDRFAENNDHFIFANRYKCKVLQTDKYTVEKLEVIDTKFAKCNDQ